MVGQDAGSLVMNGEFLRFAARVPQHHHQRVAPPPHRTGRCQDPRTRAPDGDLMSIAAPGDYSRSLQRPLAPQSVEGDAHRLSQCLLRLARSSEIGHPVNAYPTEPPCTDPYARWCGRGGAARLPPYPDLTVPFDVITVGRIGSFRGRSLSLLQLQAVKQRWQYRRGGLVAVVPK